MNKQKKFGQYFTPQRIALALVDQLNNPITKVIEFGAGDGALARAVYERFPNSNYIGIEVDNELYTSLSTTLESKQKLIKANAFHEHILTKYSELSAADTIIGNPPFITTIVTNEIKDTILDVFPSFDCANMESIAAEMYFLCASIRRLKQGGQGSFILPISFLISPKYSGFRHDLISNFSSIIVTQLPVKTFSNAEVACCILSFCRSRERRQKIELAIADLNGSIIDKIEIHKRHAVKRMDYSYFKFLKDLNSVNSTPVGTIRSLNVEVNRGSASKRKLIDSNLEYFHTTSFPENSRAISLGFNEVSSFRHARTGDILIPRVGTRCLDRQVLVAEGQKAFTDCIFKISAEEKDLDIILRSLSSKSGKAWRINNAQGKCAKFLSKSSLLDMPLFID
ncbi:MAG: SAM-dependent DNA methyltransferase [Gammaproteobacteria bacterium]|nr:SAM-dependent DNA methyltransferase [Gammaproteobacteria bacterium]